MDVPVKRKFVLTESESRNGVSVGLEACESSSPFWQMFFTAVTKSNTALRNSMILGL